MAQDFEQARTYAPVTEHLLMYSNEIGMTGLDFINNDQTLYKPIRDYFLEQKQNSNYTFKQINKECFGTASNGGGMASNILTSYKDGWTFPTQEKYEDLQKIGLCPKPYEELRKEYEELRRPFNNYMKLTDVLKFSQQTHITGKWKHPTMKPPQLCSALIRTCSRKGMNMLVPFGGSGSECIEGFHAGLNVVSSELDKEYFEMAQQRILEETAQLSLF
jgi:site-specific DNA-methyltransferase (adenine-specific)